jgi:nitroreductase
MEIVRSLGVSTIVALMAAHRSIGFTSLDRHNPDRTNNRYRLPWPHLKQDLIGRSTMDALEVLLGRSSALKLMEPAPSSVELDLILESALRAPDHGRLRPWRFVIVPSDRRVHFGEVLAASMSRRDKSVPAEVLSREREKAMRAPLIVVVAACIRRDRNIPEVEQISSAAAAAQNIMLAAHAQGYGAMWKTGAAAYDSGVKHSLGLSSDDVIIGFLYLGTRVDDVVPAARPTAKEYVSIWNAGLRRLNRKRPTLVSDGKENCSCDNVPSVINLGCGFALDQKHRTGLHQLLSEIRSLYERAHDLRLSNTERVALQRKYGQVTAIIKISFPLSRPARTQSPQRVAAAGS